MARATQESGLGRHSSMDIDEDIRFQERTWTVQRIGWALMVLLALLALLGLFAGGPLSKAVAASGPGGAVLEYERFLRYGAPSTLRLQFGDAAGDREVAVRIGRLYLDAVEIERITPEPIRAAAAAEGVEMRFSLVEDHGPGWAELSIKPRRPGIVRGEIAVAGGAPVRFAQFAYP